MPRLNNIKIPVRIAIACLVPMLAFVAFAFKDILETHSIYSSADQIAHCAACPDAWPNQFAMPGIGFPVHGSIFF